MFSITKIWFHIQQFLIGIDQLANTLFGGWADETLSARAYRRRNDNWFWRFMNRFINFLFLPFGTQHTLGAYTDELLRRQEPPEYRRWNG